MVLKAILGYLSWPLLILISLMLVRRALDKFESRVAREETTAEKPEEKPAE